MTPSRQTTDRVSLVLNGLRYTGGLTWRNGPAMFTRDDGQTVLLHRVTDGGVSSVPKRSWLRVWTAPDNIVEADIVERGERHDPWFSTLFGQGWIVTEPTWWHRFEENDGHVKLRFVLVEMCVGRPAYAEKMKRKSSRMPPIEDPDEMNWVTYTARDGSVFTFRRRGPPPPEGSYETINAGTYATLSPKAKKAYDAATKVTS